MNLAYLQAEDKTNCNHLNPVMIWNLSIVAYIFNEEQAGRSKNTKATTNFSRCCILL